MQNREEWKRKVKQRDKQMKQVVKRWVREIRQK